MKEHESLRILEKDVSSRLSNLSMNSSDTRLIFVYNADSGLLNAVRNAIHKTISPSTYPYRLCGLTFGVVRMKSVWKEFIDGLGLPVEFLHRDEFLQRYDLKDAKFL